jgi:hypothetical protein
MRVSLLWPWIVVVVVIFLVVVAGATVLTLDLKSTSRNAQLDSIAPEVPAVDEVSSSAMDMVTTTKETLQTDQIYYAGLRDAGTVTFSSAIYPDSVVVTLPNGSVLPNGVLYTATVTGAAVSLTLTDEAPTTNMSLRISNAKATGSTYKPLFLTNGSASIAYVTDAGALAVHTPEGTTTIEAVHDATAISTAQTTTDAWLVTTLGTNTGYLWHSFCSASTETWLFTLTATWTAGANIEALALAVNGDGVPVVAYTDTSAALFVRRWMAGEWVLTTDATGDTAVAFHPALSIAASDDEVWITAAKTNDIVATWRSINGGAGLSTRYQLTASAGYLAGGGNAEQTHGVIVDDHIVITLRAWGSFSSPLAAISFVQGDMGVALPNLGMAPWHNTVQTFYLGETQVSNTPFTAWTVLTWVTNAGPTVDSVTGGGPQMDPNGRILLLRAAGSTEIWAMDTFPRLLVSANLPST